MEVKIGVQHAPRELAVDSDETARGRREAQVTEALADGGVLALTDSKGRR